MVVHDERHNGLGPVYTLTPELLSMDSKGALGGGLHKEVRVADIVGFYAVTYNFTTMTGSVTSSMEQFLLTWREGNQIRRDKWMVAVGTPSFQLLLQELARLRPDASLLHLPSSEAHRRLGMTSLKSVWIIAAVVALLAVVVVVIAVILGLVFLAGSGQ